MGLEPAPPMENLPTKATRDLDSDVDGFHMCLESLLRGSLIPAIGAIVTDPDVYGLLVFPQLGFLCRLISTLIAWIPYSPVFGLQMR